MRPVGETFLQSERDFFLPARQDGDLSVLNVTLLLDLRKYQTRGDLLNIDPARIVLYLDVRHF